MTNNLLTQFDQVVAELLTYGEDSEELTFWRNIFPGLSPSQQQQLLDKLQQELKTLQAIGR